MSLMPKFAKYSAVGKVTVSNQLAYVYDLLVRSLFLIVILYVFVQLWGVTFKGVGTTEIAGYRYNEMIWYLIFAESIIMAAPKLTVKVEEEVKRGDIGYQLIRPMSYLLYHYASFMGEASVRLLVHLAVGGMLGICLFGWPDWGWGWLAFSFVAAGAFTVNFIITMTLALCAFWVEETRGLDFVYNKLVFTIGGMMLPLDMFPAALREVCGFLPFQTIAYFPARIAVHFDGADMAKMLGIQLLWIGILSLLLTAVYRKGVAKLNVNGG